MPDDENDEDEENDENEGSAGDGGSGGSAGSEHSAGHGGSGGTAGSAGSGGSGGTSGTGGTGNDPVVNGCVSFVDRTAAGAARALTWSFDIASDPLRCIRIKVGQIVCWNGDFEEHPLEARGGDTPNPIGASDCATFSAAGDFGYICTLHEEMNGVVQVVP